MLRNIIEQIECDTLLIVVKEVQTIWKNLIDSYRKKVKSGSSGEPVDEQASRGRYFDRMNFLKAFVVSKKYVTNICQQSMNYKQHHKEVTVDLHKIINRLMYMYTLWIFFTEQRLMYLEETIRMTKGPMEMQMQVVQVQEQVGTTNKVRTIRIILMLTIMMHTHLKIKVDLLWNIGKRSKCSSRTCSKTLEQLHPAEPTEPEEYWSCTGCYQ